MSKDFFYSLFGFPESDYEITKSKFSLDTSTKDPDTNLDTTYLTLKSDPNKRWNVGRFHYPMLGELRMITKEYIDQYTNGQGDSKLSEPSSNKLSFCCIQADVQSLHGHPENANAIFQVASQFNCLEFIKPGVSPEEGITDYASDMTQGPACCLCTVPAAVYRNYLHQYEERVVVGNGPTSNNQVLGQTSNRQADMLCDLSRAIGNSFKVNFNSNLYSNSAIGRYWTMKGGYVMSNSEKLKKIPWHEFATEETYDALLQHLRIGIHEDIEVTHCGGYGEQPIVGNSNQMTGMKVTHCLCSAVPVSYNIRSSRTSDWEPLARAILKASYECVFHAAVMNMERHGGPKGHSSGSKKVFLTFIGGGVFGNKRSWINDAITDAVMKFRDVDLEVILVCYGSIDAESKKLVKDVKRMLEE